jgi:hypothetical protein
VKTSPVKTSSVKTMGTSLLMMTMRIIPPVTSPGQARPDSPRSASAAQPVTVKCVMRRAVGGDRL